MIHLVSLNPALDLFFELKKEKTGKIGRVLESRIEAGGKAVNIARFLKVVRVPYVLWLGTGGGDHPTHVLYRSLLRKENLSAKFLGSDSPIRINLVIAKDRSTEKYNHPGLEAEYTRFAKLLKVVKRGDVLVLTGRLPAGNNPALYSSWVETFQKRGVFVMIDTSGSPLKLSLAAHPYFFKVNRHEFSYASAKPIGNLQQAKSFIQKKWGESNFTHGAITDGQNGALVWQYPECYWVRPSNIISRFVVGAGDAFLAGYLSALNDKKSFTDKVVRAAAFGSVVARYGIHGLTRGRIRQQVQRTKIERVL